MSHRSLDALPQELILAVLYAICHCAQGDLLAIASTNRMLHDATIPSLYRTVVLNTASSVSSFAHLARGNDERLLFVRNLSPWGGLTLGDGNARKQICDILVACAGLVNIQIFSHNLYKQGQLVPLVLPNVEEMYVWLHRDWSAVDNGIFRRVKRLHIADLQSWVSYEAEQSPRPEHWLATLRQLFRYENFPELQYLSMTMAPYQFFEESEVTLFQLVVRAVLELNGIVRLIVRMTGPDTIAASFVAFLTGLHDPRVFLLSYFERHPELADNLISWRLNALGQRGMWNAGLQMFNPNATRLPISDHVQGLLESLDEDDEDVYEESTVEQSNLERAQLWQQLRSNRV
ncbi:hypothetical protein BKA62DRAFT_370196 [Auriculariales sp. MPI-PUGE-AT-0066]|nr:hypothetical protein BKA62DRAFT_370196 [Auriculariales sp. MPI-PUGE-AT-0066]